MKKTLLFAFIVYACVSCGRGDVFTPLRGKIFVNEKVLSDGYRMTMSFAFENSGNVINSFSFGNRSDGTKGRSLYYKMDGSNFTIYYGSKGWNKGVSGSEYKRGSYMIDYIIVDGLRYDLQK